MFSQEFMRNALLAGTFIALACGVSGWFVVLRGQVFAGDALSHVAFPGALAAAAAGVDERVGLFGATIAVGAGIGLLGQRSFAGGRGTAASGAGRRHGDRRGVHVRARPGRVLPDAVQHELRRWLGHPGRTHAVRLDLRPRLRRSAPGGRDRARGGAGDARDRPPAAVRLGLPGRGRGAGRADEAARHRLRDAAGGRCGRGDPGRRRAAVARAARAPRRLPHTGSRATPTRGSRSEDCSRWRRCGLAWRSATPCRGCRRARRS